MSTPPEPLLQPTDTIGILGGGQLGRMLATAASRLGLRTCVLAPEENAPAFDVASQCVRGAYDDPTALDAFAKSARVATYEFENVPAETVKALEERGVDVAPGAKALAAAQDRLHEKEFIRSIGAETAPFHAVDGLETLEEGLQKIGRPAILKTRRFGYDGKGQTIIGDDPDLGETWEQAKEKAWREIGARPSILEGFVDFAFEISIIGARARDGSVALYDPPRNDHRGGILRTSTTPSGASEETISQAGAIATRLLEALDYVGVAGIEFFVLEGGGLMVNEFAPRVHNSGHWTIEACAVSQFEQQIRAVAGWPLGDPVRHSDAEMHNLIGDDAHQWRALAADPGASLHLYGKGEARTGRKMGHVTRLNGSATQR
ncbi:MAG: 5-(carboxyamino)imidazole ribonucleotide synthase [Pseudomonadota bacterium]